MKLREVVERDLFPRNDTFLSRSISWSVNGPGGYAFNYYACYVQDLGLWFFTGIQDYYKAKGGMTTEYLLTLLNDPDHDVTSLWFASDWDEIT